MKDAFNFRVVDEILKHKGDFVFVFRTEIGDRVFDRTSGVMHCESQRVSLRERQR